MVSRALEAASGALRVYAIAFGEGSQHIHVHLVPRLPARDDTAAWKIADWYRAVERGEVPPADPQTIAKVIEDVRSRLLAASVRVDSPMRWFSALA
jgi:diadenosine tetraphosphate (Ap4A) HIT family hydrolase